MKIGTVVRLGPLPEGAQPSAYADIKTMATAMEDAGMDSIWVYDHLLYRSGVGAGWHQPEFDAFGIPFDRRVSRFEEALNIIGRCCAPARSTMPAV